MGRSLHLLVEDLGLAAGGLADEALVQQGQDGVANLLELGLHLGAVLPGELGLRLVALGLLLLLHAGDDAPGSTAAAHCILVCHGQQVPLLNGELIAEGTHRLHVLCHLVIALSLAYAHLLRASSQEQERDSCKVLWQHPAVAQRQHVAFSTRATACSASLAK